MHFLHSPLTYKWKAKLKFLCEIPPWESSWFSERMIVLEPPMGIGTRTIFTDFAFAKSTATLNWSTLKASADMEMNLHAPDIFESSPLHCNKQFSIQSISRRKTRFSFYICYILQHVIHWEKRSTHNATEHILCCSVYLLANWF